MFVKYARGIYHSPGRLRHYGRTLRGSHLDSDQPHKAISGNSLGKDYWKDLISWMKKNMLVKHSMIDPDDMDLFQCIDDPGPRWWRAIKRIVIV